jgi:CDP-4-dehydro-6-deoxyglucose reductase
MPHAGGRGAVACRLTAGTEGNLEGKGLVPVLRLARCEGAGKYAAQVLEVQALSSRVLRIRLSRPAGFAYSAGQFIQLVRPADGIMRPYSLASTPDELFLELHVALLPQGKLSSWLADAEGQQVTLRGPYGECFYVQEPVPRPLLLVGTGTGLAPLYGVLRTALAAGHSAAMRLIHGAADAEGLYLWSAIRALAGTHRQLECMGSVQGGAEAPGMSREPLQTLVQQCGLPLADVRIYLCGNPDFVRNLRKQLYLAGTPLARIHADPFLPPADPSHS